MKAIRITSACLVTIALVLPVFAAQAAPARYASTDDLIAAARCSLAQFVVDVRKGGGRVVDMSATATISRGIKEGTELGGAVAASFGVLELTANGGRKFETDKMISASSEISVRPDVEITDYCKSPRLRVLDRRGRPLPDRHGLLFTKKEVFDALPDPTFVCNVTITQTFTEERQGQSGLKLGIGKFSVTLGGSGVQTANVNGFTATFTLDRASPRNSVTELEYAKDCTPPK